MRKLILVGVLLLAFAVTGLAEGVKPVFYAGGGISLPVSPSELDDLAAIGIKIGIKDMYKSGVNFGGGVGFQVSPMFELVGRVDYNSFSFDDEGFSDALVKEFERLLPVPGLSLDVDVEGGTLKLLEFMGDVKFLIPVGGEAPAFQPFLLGGIGITKAEISESEWTMSISYLGLDTTFTELIPSESETKFAFNFGAGFDWMVSPTVGIFVEGRYAQVALAGDPIGYLPVRGGLIVKLGQ